MFWRAARSRVLRRRWPRDTMCRRRQLSIARLEEPSQRPPPSFNRLERSFSLPAGNDAVAPKIIEAGGKTFGGRFDPPYFGDRLTAMGDRHHVALSYAVEQFAQSGLCLVGRVG